MNSVEIFSSWAPTDGTWSPWVKPVLFAMIYREFGLATRSVSGALPTVPEWFVDEVIRPLEVSTSPLPDVYRNAASLSDVAIVVDLPSDQGTDLGVALTVHGFRPIPLYNAVPGRAAIVAVGPIVGALQRGAVHVGSVPRSAPPVFLLDANRMGPVRSSPHAGFDNRSICRVADFPSAERFKQAGIRRILLYCDVVQDDLESIALEWQAAGLALWVKRPSERRPAEPVTMRPPWFGRRLWVRLQHSALTPRADGAYGTLVEPPSAS